MPSISSLGFTLNRRPITPVNVVPLPNVSTAWAAQGGETGGTQEEIPLSTIPQIIPNNSIDYDKLTIQTLNVNQHIKGGATGYDEGEGFWLGNDGDDYKFFLGDSAGDKITWDGSTLSITGSLIAGDIHIPDTTTDDSFHVNSTGNMWIGCNVADYASAEENAEVYFHNDGTGFLKTTLQVGESSTDYLTIDGANQKIVTNDYVSGVAGVGWSIDSNLAEFANIYARGKISTAVFQKDVISSVGGNLIVLNSDVLATDIAASDTTYTISGDSTFAVHDVLRMKDGIDDEWARVTSIAAAPTYGVLRNPDTNSLVDEMDYATNALIQAEWSGKTKATLYANTEISDCDSATGWSSFAGISNISLNTTNQLEGTGCIEADFASGNSNIQKSLSSLDISAYYGTGFIILPVYLPNVTNLTYFRIWVVTTWNTDYDNFQVTTDINGDAFKVGWNILSFDTSSPNASVGTIDPTDINLIYFQNPETWNATDVLIDHIALYPTEINPNFSMVIEDCDATTDWSGGNIANLAVNTDYRLEGTGCLSFDTTGAGGEAMLLQNALALDVSHIYGDGYIIFPIYLPSITGLSGIEFHISSTWASDRDYKTVTTDINGNALKVGWNIISIDTSNMSHTGTFDPTAVDAIRIDLNGSLATTGVLIDDIQLYLQEEPNKYLAFTDPAEPILNSYWGGFMNNAPNVNWYWVASPTSSDVSAITGVSSGAPTNGRVGFWIKTDNKDAINYIILYLGSASANRIYSVGTTIPAQVTANNTATFIELDLTDFTTTGTPDWENFDYAAFAVAGTEPFMFEVSDIRFYGDAAGDTWKKGATVVSYGQPDEGGLLQTASESNAPYMSIFTHDGEPWDGTDTKARLGNLAGITDTTFGALSGYGLWTDSGYFTGSIFATAGYFGDSTNRVAIESDGLNVGSSGVIRGGATDYLTGIGFWMGNDSGTYKLGLGNPASNYIAWDGTDLTIVGGVKNVRFFGGDGSDGAQGDTDNTITGSDDTIIIKNYSSWAAGSVARTCTVTPTGCVVILKIQGDADFTNWTFDFAAKGAVGGDGGTTGGVTTGTVGADSERLFVCEGGGISAAAFNNNWLGHTYGGGGGGGSGGASLENDGNDGEDGTTGGSPLGGGIAGEGGTASVFKLSSAQASKAVLACVGAGGAGGGCGAGGSDGGDGGLGGGDLFIEVAGDVIFSSTSIDVSGENGEDGGTGVGAGGGGGGGGGGGCIFVLYNGSATGSPSTDITGGTGGTGGPSVQQYRGDGGDGGDGADGPTAIVEQNLVFP